MTVKNTSKILKRLTKFEVIVGSILFLLPLILWVATGEIRPSISNYAYSDLPFLLPTLLTLSGSLFMYNGVVHRDKWYNIVIGLLLIGVALTPHLDYPLLHYIFTGAFFVGSAAVMIIYSSTKQRPLKIIAGIIMVLAIALSFLFKLFSVFLAEWIGIFPITIHFIGESLNKID